MSFAPLPDVRAEQSPDAPCIADDTISLSNVEFFRRVRAAASVLRRHGLGRGDVVAVMLPNRVELVVLLFAAWRLGAAVTPINPALTATEAGYQLADSGAKVLVDVDGAALDPGVVTLGVADLSDPTEPDLGEPVADPSALALLIYTSGSTGTPKGVMLDHANLDAMCRMSIDALEVDAGDHSLLVLPLFHVNGIVVSVLTPLLAGGRTTIAGRFAPDTFFGTVERVRPTYFSAVPTIYALLSALPEQPRPDTSSVRAAICGAAPMPAGLIERFEERYGITVVEGYGLSEGTCASTVNPLRGVRKPGTVGLPFPGQRIAILGPDGVHVTDGSAGEVLIQGPNVMRGYLGRPEETAATVVDGWLHTGDVGRLDADGYLVLVDRVKDMIIRGGENIYPKEIENALYAHREVLDAAVVGEPHPTLGEVPVAFVTLRPGSGATAEALLEHCRARLSKYKWPTRLTLLDAIPKNAVGKIDKPTLRAGLADAR
ncbi:MAG TPA: AMP-binding protein [Mycobacteriales bacterium]|jgi:acyl-CoA synthetase (AMP-forming)/AMP-acid ligase II|nr:acyl-CoA synthetase (AMP-forming)/AMP-acid ligase [Mycobacterium sp.]